MADFITSLNYVLDNEDRPRQYKTVPDAPGQWRTDENGVPVVPKIWDGAQAISGINSKAFPQQFAQINAIPQPQRGPAVENFYRVQFWNQWLGQLELDDLACRVMDSEVNQGSGTGVKILQTAINTFWSSVPPDPNVRIHSVAVDGKWGPWTVLAANQAGEPLVGVFKSSRVDFYKKIKAPSPATLAAWIARAEK